MKKRRLDGYYKYLLNKTLYGSNNISKSEMNAFKEMFSETIIRNMKAVNNRS